MTLIEIMFTAGIIAITLAMLAGSIMTLHAARALEGDRTAAVARMATIFDELRRADAEALLAYVPPAFDMPPVSDVQILYVVDAKGATVAPPVSAESLGAGFTLPNPLEVRVTIATTGTTGRRASVTSATMLGR